MDEFALKLKFNTMLMNQPMLAKKFVNTLFRMTARTVRTRTTSMTIMYWSLKVSNVKAIVLNILFDGFKRFIKKRRKGKFIFVLCLFRTCP